MEKHRTPGEEIQREAYEAAEATARSAGKLWSLSRVGARYALEELGQPIHGGFMIDNGNGTFTGYGWTNYQRGTAPNYHYYFLGAVSDDPKPTGIFYFFDCTNAFTNDGYFPAEDFADDDEAITTGADYEADVYRVTLANGVETARELLYTPYEGQITARA